MQQEHHYRVQVGKVDGAGCGDPAGEVVGVAVAWVERSRREFVVD
ncbi:hypothetical protein [Parafrankia sp. EAN1pec]